MSGPSADPRRPRTAIVIGSSLAGMLAAHVAARRFERVLLLERAEAATGVAPRRSVPQERHVHLLLQRGKRVLEELLPGFTAELERLGAVVADSSRDIAWFHGERWKRRFETGIYTHYCTRSLIDHVIRERIQQSPRITLVPNTRVTGLLRDAGSEVITGVTTMTEAGPQRLQAELVIDASGRGSQAHQWIAELSGQEVRVSEVTSKLGYGTRLYQRRREYDDAWKVLMVLPRPPRSRRLGVISPIEGDRWMVTTGGWLGECPGGSEREFLEFLRSLPDQAVYDVIRDATPLSDVSIYRMPGGARRHFEEVHRWPGRFLVIGDAMCSFNPIYSQGMTVSALEVEALGHGLDALVASGGSAAMTRALQRTLATQVNVPWEMAQAEDLRFPEVAGERGWRLKLMHTYSSLVAEASSVDEVVCKQLLQVINLVESPAKLAAPMFQARVLATAARMRLGPLIAAR